VRDEEEASGFKLEVVSDGNRAFSVVVIYLFIDQEVLTNYNDTTWSIRLSWDLYEHVRGFIYRS
jgi:hypothetical protein